MDRLKNCLLVRFDGRRRKLIIDYVYRGQVVPGEGILLTYIPVKDLQAISPSGAARRIGETLLISLPGAFRAVYGSKPEKGRGVPSANSKGRPRRP